MEDFLYAYNQPKQFGKYDLLLDGKVTANELIYKILTEEGEYQNINIAEKVKEIDSELAKRVPYSLLKNVNVVGNIKDVVKLDVPESSNEAMYCPQGLIMGGTAKDAGLVTRGICGISTSKDNGSCEKENLYINYDGTNTYSSSRQLILQAGESGVYYGHNLYQFAVARGDAVKGYVDELVNQLQSRITKLERTVEELKAHHRVEYTVEHENPTEPTE